MLKGEIKLKAILLNSGMGTRLEKITKYKPKCMTEIGFGYTIISWQLKTLKDFDISDIIITTGYKSKQLMEYINSMEHNLNIIYIENNLYNETNYIYSMYLARKLMDCDMIIMHGDLVYEKSILQGMLMEEKSVVAIDSSLELPKKDFKAKMDGNRILKIGIEFFGNDCAACQPLYKLLNKDMKIWTEEINNYIQNGKRTVYAEDALNQNSQNIKLYSYEVKNKLCCEIDNETDLKRVSEDFAKYYHTTGGTFL